MLPIKKFLSSLRNIPPFVFYFLFQTAYIVVLWILSHKVCSSDVGICVPYYTLITLGSIVASLLVSLITAVVWVISIVLVIVASVWSISYNSKVSGKLYEIFQKQISFTYWLLGTLLTTMRNQKPLH